MARKIDGPLATLAAKGAVVVIDGNPYLRVVAVGEDGKDVTAAFPLSDVVAITNTQVFNYMTNIDPIAAKRAKLIADAAKMGITVTIPEPAPKEV